MAEVSALLDYYKTSMETQKRLEAVKRCHASRTIQRWSQPSIDRRMLEEKGYTLAIVCASTRLSKLEPILASFTVVR